MSVSSWRWLYHRLWLVHSPFSAMFHSCAVTNKEKNPWLLVELEPAYVKNPVFAVNIINYWEKGRKLKWSKFTDQISLVFELTLHNSPMSILYEPQCLIHTCLVWETVEIHLLSFPTIDMTVRLVPILIVRILPTRKSMFFYSQQIEEFRDQNR